MEARVRRVLIVAAILSAGSAWAAGQTSEGISKAPVGFEKRFPPVKKNAAAEDLEKLSLALGLDSHPSDPAADHPTTEDQDAYRQASIGTWLDAQVKTSEDSIAAPPERLNAFLQERRVILQRVVALLEKEVPEWGFDVHDVSKDHAYLLLVNNVGRILLSAALVEERGGRHAEAGELLEASWSLSQCLSAHPVLIDKMIAVALGSRQAGVLRKMSEPGFEWVGRLASDSPRKQMLEQFRIDPLMAQSQAGRESEFYELERRMGNAFVDRAAEVSPCDLAKLPYEEIWRSVDVATESPEAAEQLRVIKEMAMPNLVSALYRAARLELDRELTGKVLSLRLEKAASRERKWPAKLFEPDSRVCPGAGYDYQARSGGMLLRFQGSTRDPEAPALFLPLSFEARVPRPTPTPTPSRPPRTATPPRPPS